MTKQAQEFLALYKNAQREGIKAGEALQPCPMVVVEGDLFGNTRPDAKRYYVSEGVCGFASVIIYPATSSFARWLVKNDLARKNYNGGLRIPITAYNQSFERKEAHASAMAQVFSGAGFNCYVESRLD